MSQEKHWREVIRKSTSSGKSEEALKVVHAHYDEEQLRQVLAFIHNELSGEDGLDVYNIQYPGSVASASASESVEDVMSRLGKNVKRFILPIFRGRNRVVRVEHDDRLLVAEAPDFASIEGIRDRWTSFVGSDGKMFYGLRVSGRLPRSSSVAKVLHLVCQVVSLYDDGESEQSVVLEQQGGPSVRVEPQITRISVPCGALLCSDCAGYHAPGVAQRLQSLVGAQTFGSSTVIFRRNEDDFSVTLNIPTSSFKMDYDSVALAKVKDVANLWARAINIAK